MEKIKKFVVDHEVTIKRCFVGVCWGVFCFSLGTLTKKDINVIQIHNDNRKFIGGRDEK